MQQENLSSGPVGGAGVASHGFIAGGAANGSGTWNVFSQIPDLVNGDEDTFRYIFASPGLATPYHWICPTFTDALPDVTTQDLMTLHIVTVAAVHSILLMVGGKDALMARKAALLVACSRLAIVRAWNIREADLEPQQVFAPSENLTAGGQLVADVAGFASVAEYDAEIAAVTAVYLTGVAKEIPDVMRIAIGMPVTNGVTMVATGVHHFVDPHKQICLVVVSQVLGKNLLTCWDMAAEDFQDAVCHKAAHPIKGGRLVMLARNEEVKKRMKKINLSGAAVRMPALYGPEKTATAMRAVVMKGMSASAPANVVVDAQVTVTMMEDVTAAVEGNQTQDGMIAAEAVIAEYELAHGHGVAWLAGFLTGSFDAADAGRIARTTVTAKSVVRMCNENWGAFDGGRRHYDLFAKWEKARAKEGHLMGIALFGAVTPDARVNPEMETAALAKKA